MNSRRNEEVEIDLKELFFVLLHKIWIVILAGLLLAVGAGLFSELLVQPMYTSTTQIYIINRQSEDTTTLSDLQTGTQLTKDYMILVKSRPVMEEVIKQLNLDISREALANSIHVSTPEGTRILEIGINYPDAKMAKQIADAVANVSAERMVSIMEMKKVNIVEPGNLPTVPSSPNIKISIILGGIVGSFLSSFLILLIYILNDSIRTSEDIEKYLGITTLGTIPFEQGATRKHKGKHKQSITQVAQIN